MASTENRFALRRRRLAEALAAEGLDAFLVTSPLSVRYLTGFTGSNGALVVFTDRDPVVCTDGRYTTQIAEEVPDITAEIERRSGVHLASRTEEPATVGIDAARTSMVEYSQLEEAAAAGVTFRPATGVVEQLRLVKDDEELAALRTVAEVANVAFAEMIDAGELRAGRSEREVAADLEYRMRRGGADTTSFDTIVASGPNSAKPHHGADDRVIAQGDLVTIDFGAYLGGYNSDMTRTLAVGEPDDFSREIYQVVLEAQRAGIAAARVGATGAEVDQASRDVIEAAGYGEYFVHSTGHGVGLEVHEAPAAARGSADVLQAGMTVTVEPGIYVPGKGGVRIEDTLIITVDGPETITRFPTELTVLD
ncbi:X-Pro dipeptidase [Corynebacterium atypicum]|uniref:X-Pro dipeptidase n=1 Tax=Corynebacterium atypicum TaxID=191610 RepID=A0ABN4DCD1_9CORY|nr:Xaa-Pro peptidase family protein [Corynebacterium atypicum]AIG64065.1 X-Pro dipeptidase [Corynebacterium atypicum]